MTEAGGPTTQSGILYQNSIVALNLGRLCDKALQSQSEPLIEVICEARAKVDDVFLLFQGGRQEFIQAKEAMETSSDVWDSLWRSFARQFLDTKFDPKRDRMTLYLGELREEYRYLAAIAKRSLGSKTFDEWLESFNKVQAKIFAKIEPILIAENLDKEQQLDLFRCLTVVTEPMEDLKSRAFREMPRCNVPPLTLFRLLRDRVGENARHRMWFNRPELLHSLQSQDGISFETGAAGDRSYSPLSFLPNKNASLQWFVSSRLKDDCLRKERDAVIDAIESNSMSTPWSWENDAPAGHDYEEICLHFAAKSDGFVLILGDDLSPMCRKEYMAAFTAKIPCFVFVKNTDSSDESLLQFIAEQREQGRNPVYFRNEKELKSRLGVSLNAQCVQLYRHSLFTLQTSTPRLATL